MTRRRLAIALVVCAALYAILDLVLDPTSLGRHDWDSAESYRWFVADSLRHYGQVPFWDPHSCGGAPFWGAPQTTPMLVSPVLAAYLSLPLGLAIRIEIVAMLAFGLVGTWLLVSRFCKDPMLVALATVVGLMSSRWALQAGAGHDWHLHYAWLPWALLAFSHAVHRPRAAPWIGVTAGILALMVYDGALYPLPHTLLAISLYALYVALHEKRVQPLLTLVTVGVGAVALAAPKLLAIADTMGRFPRTVDSPEYIMPQTLLRTIVWPSGAYSSTPQPGYAWAYHEYGIYIGVLGLVAVIAGVVFAAPRRPDGSSRDTDLRALRFAAIVLLLLSFGQYGPWPLLHHIPPFRSQHVPTRFAYPALLMFSAVAAAGLERTLARRLPRHASIGAVVLALAVIVPIAIEDRSCIAPAFGVELPAIAERPSFEQTYAVPPDLAYPEANGPPSITVHEARAGTILCSTFHAFNHDAWIDQRGRPAGLGAIGKDEPGYRGEVYVENDAGSAKIVEWSPNEITVDVQAPPGAYVVLDQNWDPSWTANGEPTESHTSVNAHKLGQGEHQVAFRYVPRTLRLGLAVAVLAVLVLGFAIARSRRAHSSGSSGSG